MTGHTLCPILWSYHQFSHLVSYAKAIFTTEQPSRTQDQDMAFMLTGCHWETFEEQKILAASTKLVPTTFFPSQQKTGFHNYWCSLLVNAKILVTSRRTEKTELVNGMLPLYILFRKWVVKETQTTGWKAEFVKLKLHLFPSPHSQFCPVSVLESFNPYIAKICHPPPPV